MVSSEKQLKVCLQLAESFCARREHCCSEIVDKLGKHNYPVSIIENVLKNLQENNFINEERYAVAYTHDKFILRKWGKIKIRQMLRGKKISENSIEKALTVIENVDYQTMVKDLILKKSDKLKEKNLLKRKQKLIAFAMSKGFEKNVVWEIMDDFCQPTCGHKSTTFNFAKPHP